MGKNYLQVAAEIEDVFLKGIPSKWDEVLIRLMPDNPFYPAGFERGFWLTKARRYGDKNMKPYCCKQIGMNKEGTGDKDRWGKMFYLSTDMTYNASFKEKGICDEKINGTLGYFFIKNDLKLFNATWSSATGNAEEIYNGVDARTALFALVYLIDKWFNAEQVRDGKVYRITQHVADLIRNSTDLDGVVYKCGKNNELTWNVALVDDNKVTWGYSVLLVPDKFGVYKEYSYCQNEKYEEMKRITKELILDPEMTSVDSVPLQSSSIFSHRFI